MTNKFEKAFVELRHYLIQQIEMCSNIYNKLYLSDDKEKYEQCHSWRNARDQLRNIQDMVTRLEFKFKLNEDENE